MSFNLVFPLIQVPLLDPDFLLAQAMTDRLHLFLVLLFGLLVLAIQVHPEDCIKVKLKLYHIR